MWKITALVDVYEINMMFIKDYKVLESSKSINWLIQEEGKISNYLGWGEVQLTLHKPMMDSSLI